jgi:phosphoadenosine phosphosulfate reductase
MLLKSLTQDLAREHRAREARAAIALGRSGEGIGEIALVSSFGAEAAVLLHIVAQTDPHLPVLFLDTGKHFAETLDYQDRLARALGLKDLRRIKPDAQTLQENDPYGALHTHDTKACCALRKVTPLSNALTGFDGWITGRKRYQGGLRKSLTVFEADEATGKLKINPLAHWSMDDIRDYADHHALPAHPLTGRGYLSIGCAPCTAPTAPGADSRSGRWAGQDTAECGIHISAAPARTQTQGTAP